MIFNFTPTKLKIKINFVALRVNKKFTFYCDKLSIEMKKSQLHTPPHSTQFRYRKKNRKILTFLKNLKKNFFFIFFYLNLKLKFEFFKIFKFSKGQKFYSLQKKFLAGNNITR